jgi:hypothetical protein
MINPYRKDRYRNAAMDAALNKIRVKRWVEQSGYSIPIDGATNLFEITARAVHKDAVNYAIKSLGFIDGLIRANDTLQVQMDMAQVGYTVNDGIRIASDVLRMIIAQELLKRANLPEPIKNQALHRLVARLLPLRDNIQRPPNVVTGPTNSQAAPATPAEKSSPGPTIREKTQQFRTTLRGSNSHSQNPTYF